MYINTRQRKNESFQNFMDRTKLNNKVDAIGCNLSTDEYIDFLEQNNLEYIKVEKEKDNGKKITLTIPSCQFKVLSRADINKLFNF